MTSIATTTSTDHVAAALLAWSTEAQHRGDGWHSEAAQLVLSLHLGVSDDPEYALAALLHWSERSDRYAPADRAVAELVEAMMLPSSARV